MKTTTPRRIFRTRGQILSPGAWIILVLAIVSGLFLVTRKSNTGQYDITYWVFADTHYDLYRKLTYGPGGWNERHGPGSSEPFSPLRVDFLHLSINAEQQRMMSAFYSGTPVADLIEIERGKIGAAFALPLNKIGLWDMTDRIRKEGIFDVLHEPAFSPWTSRGRIFGLPHDIHPCLLAYRADIIEEAGIDVSKIETWDDYIRLLGPLMSKIDPDKKEPFHFLLNLYTDGSDQIEMLILQNDGRYFDDYGVPEINSPQNAQTVAQIVLWCTGKTLNEGGTRIAYKAPEFNASADALRANGKILGSLVPDWMPGFWRRNNPQLAGKIKFMPIPAWRKGGRRTSIWGGTMLSISKKTAEDPVRLEKAWYYAKKLYTDPRIAEALWRDAHVVSPVKTMWSNPIYDEPSEFYSNQPVGRLFLNMAPTVPLRTSSPFHDRARSLLSNVVLSVQKYAADKNVTSLERLQDEAQRGLNDANKQLEKLIREDLFVDPKKEVEQYGTSTAPEAK